MPHKTQTEQLSFKKSYVAAASKLREAKVSANERIVYDSLTRMSELKGHEYKCTRAQKDIARETGLSERSVKELISNLRKRCFFWNGVEIPIIELIQSGTRGHVSIYRDNLTAYVRNQSEDPIKFFGLGKAQPETNAETSIDELLELLPANSGPRAK